MLEKPNLRDEVLIACLQDSYCLASTGIEFLPIGNDATAWVYRVRADDGAAYFLKLKKGVPNPASLLIPRYLKDNGLEQIIAPVPTTMGQLGSEVGAFTVILYPFVEGVNGMTSGLSDAQWVEYGTTLRRIHSARLPPDLLPYVRRETFSPKWSQTIRDIERQIRNSAYTAPNERKLAEFWTDKRSEIEHITARAEELGRLLQSRLPEFVLCHADIHTANILLASQGRLFVVDWDEALLAPKERDLMFVAGNAVSGANVEARNERLFFEGYGAKEIDPLALAYYRYEWVVQEIGDYDGRVCLAREAGDETKRDAVQGFQQLFQPDDVVEAAYASDQKLPGSKI